MFLSRSIAFTITLLLIRTVVVVVVVFVVVVVVNINFLSVAERNKLLILLAVPAVLAVILLVLPAVLAVLLLVLLVLLVLLTSQSFLVPLISSLKCKIILQPQVYSASAAWSTGACIVIFKGLRGQGMYPVVWSPYTKENVSV